MVTSVLKGCRGIDEFQYLNKIGEGAYGIVYKACDKKSDIIVTVKEFKIQDDEMGFPITSLREIKILMQINHPNIIAIRDLAVTPDSNKFYVVFDYIEHDMKSFMETMKLNQETFLQAEVKCLIKQLLSAVAYLHTNWILHRDLKISNLLLNSKGILKVSDFGLSREYGFPTKPYSPTVVTLWYRAPELLYKDANYSTPVDMWSVGCIMGELLRMEPLFPGESEIDQIKIIFKTLHNSSDSNGLPIQLYKHFPMLSQFGLDLLGRLLKCDPNKRITAEGALAHEYLTEHPFPIEATMFPLHLGIRANKCTRYPKTFEGPQMQFGSSFVLKF